VRLACAATSFGGSNCRSSCITACRASSVIFVSFDTRQFLVGSGPFSDLPTVLLSSLNCAVTVLVRAGGGRTSTVTFLSPRSNGCDFAFKREVDDGGKRAVPGCDRRRQANPAARACPAGTPAVIAEC